MNVPLKLDTALFCRKSQMVTVPSSPAVQTTELAASNGRSAVMLPCDVFHDDTGPSATRPGCSNESDWSDAMAARPAFVRWMSRA